MCGYRSSGRALLHLACFTPGDDQLSKACPHALHQLGVCDLFGEPCFRRLAKDRSAYREAAARRARPRIAETGRELVDGSVQAQEQHAATIRIALCDERVDRAPLHGGHRRELPPFGTDAEVVEALQRAEHGIWRAGQLRWRDDLEQQLVPAL